jgi:hypothetical protein
MLFIYVFSMPSYSCLNVICECWLLTQAQDVLHRESGGMNNEWRCLLLWASMLKELTMTEKARVEARQQYLDVREELLNMLQTAINSSIHDS